MVNDFRMTLQMGSVIFRKDYRTLYQFQKDIKTWCKRERVWATIIANDVSERYNYKINVINTAHSNGRIIKKRITKVQPDAIFDMCGRKIPIEIKSYYTDKAFDEIPFFTFKVSSLKAVCGYHGMLVVVNRSWWLSIDDLAITCVVNTFPHAVYYDFSPNDKAIRISKKEMAVLIKQKKVRKYAWTPTSQAMIAAQQKVLFGH